MEPTLYIVMRSDLQDMNPGKGMAQAAHAQADFDAYMQDLIEKSEYPEKAMNGLMIEYAAWLGGRNFGRTIVLEAPSDKLAFIGQNGKHSGVTTDPTYPWKNYYGELYVSEEVTCAWAFICNDNAEDLELTADLSLHR